MHEYNGICSSDSTMTRSLRIALPRLALARTALKRGSFHVRAGSPSGSPTISVWSNGYTTGSRVRMVMISLNEGGEQSSARVSSLSVRRKGSENSGGCQLDCARSSQKRRCLMNWTVDRPRTSAVFGGSSPNPAKIPPAESS